jgi:hypothetical protein
VVGGAWVRGGFWFQSDFREFQVLRGRRTGWRERADRFLNALWEQTAEIHDLHFGPAEGTFFSKAKPLTLQARFEEAKRKRKKP